MKKFLNPWKSSKVFYEGEIMTYTLAGSVLIKKMIEEDLINHSGFCKEIDPYEWVGEKIGKKAKTIRSWTYDWSSSSGASPTVVDFFSLINILGKSKVISFLECLNSNNSPESQAEEYGNLIKTIAERLRKLADDLDTLSEKYEH